MSHTLYSFANPEYAAAFDAEKREIEASSAEQRRDLFNAEFPAPYTGPITPALRGRFDAIGRALLAR